MNFLGNLNFFDNLTPLQLFEVKVKWEFHYPNAEKEDYTMNAIESLNITYKKLNRQGSVLCIPS